MHVIVRLHQLVTVDDERERLAPGWYGPDDDFESKLAGSDSSSFDRLRSSSSRVQLTQAADWRQEYPAQADQREQTT
jgi:hypothetical protein